MRYFKIIEVTEEEYLDKTNDPYYDTCFAQSTIPVEEEVYVATVEDRIEIDLSVFDKEESDAIGENK